MGIDGASEVDTYNADGTGISPTTVDNSISRTYNADNGDRLSPTFTRITPTGISYFTDTDSSRTL